MTADPGSSPVDLVTESVVRAELARQSKRRHWGHLLVAFAGTVTALAGELGVIVILSDHGASLGGRDRLWEYASLFVVGALVASFGWQRYQIGRALARFPLTFVAVGLLLPLLALTASVDRAPGPDNNSSTAAVVSAATDDGGGGLAATLVDQDVAAALMGPAFDGPEPALDKLVRARSMVRYRGNGRTLSLIVAHDPRGARRSTSAEPRVRSRTASARTAAGDWTVRVSVFGAPGDEAAPLVETLLATAQRRLEAALRRRQEGPS